MDNQDRYYEPKQLRQARSLLKQGQKRTAMQLIRATLRSLERGFERHHPLVLSFQLDLVRFLRELEMQREANRMLLVCKKRVEELLGTGHPFDGRIPAEFGVTLTGYGLFEEALECFDQAQELIDTNRADFNYSLSLDLAVSWCESALALDRELPDQQYQFIASELQSVGSVENLQLSSTLIERITYVLSCGDNTSKEVALLLQINQLMAKNFEIEVLLNTLSELDLLLTEHQDQGRITEIAIGLYPEIEEKFGGNSHSFAQYCKFCGDLAYLKSDYHAAIGHFNQTLAIIKDNHPDLARECHHNLGTCYVALENYPAALTSYQTALSFRKILQEAGHLLCESMLAMVLILRIQGNNRLANRYVKAFSSQFGNAKELAQSLAWRRLKKINLELNSPSKEQKTARNGVETTIIEEDRLNLIESDSSREDDLNVTAELYARGLQYIENREFRKAVLAFERVIEIMKASSSISERETRPVIEMLVVGYKGLGDSSKVEEMRSIRDSLAQE